MLLRSVLLSGLAVLALLALPVGGGGAVWAAQAACPPNPSPPDAADPSMIVDRPADTATVTSPVRISGRARVFEANVRITIFDAAGTILADTFTTAAEAGPALAPYDTTVAFSVATAQPGCIRVFEESAQDGRPVNVVQVEVTLSPMAPPVVGTGGLLDSGGSGPAARVPLAGGLIAAAALLGAGLVFRRRLRA